MRSEIQPGDFPGETGRSSLVRDVSSYHAVGQAAGRVYDDCIKKHHVPGWAQVGRSLRRCYALSLTYDENYEI